MTIQELKKVLNHGNWHMVMTDLPDIHNLLTKLGYTVAYYWPEIDAAVEKDPHLFKSQEKVFIMHNIDWNLVCNLKVLEISEDFTIRVGYEKFHS